MTLQHDFADGKYTVINDNGKLTALRHGEPWGRDLVGDNLVYWMLVEVDALQTQRDELLSACKKAQHALCGHSEPDAWNACVAAIAKATGVAA